MTHMEPSCLRNQVKYTRPMIDSDHRNVLWYSGDVLHIERHGYVVTLRASGDVVAEYQSDPADKTMVSVKDRSCRGVFYEKLNSAIENDDELTHLIETDQSPEHAWLELTDSNWWEALVSKDGLETGAAVLDSTNYDEALTEMLEDIDSIIGMFPC